jgi:hypothetical protein
MVRGHRQHRIHAWFAGASKGRRSAREALHRWARSVHDESDSIGVRFIADRVWCASGKRHDSAGRGLDSPNFRIEPDVEGELPLNHVVDLARVVPVHDRRSTAGRHPDTNGEQRTAGLGTGRKHRDLVGS